MIFIRNFILSALTLLVSAVVYAQQDTTAQKSSQTATPLFDSGSVAIKDSTGTKKIISKDTTARKDSVARKQKHDPRKATFRSAVLPGWGQAYNRQYWKIPVVYGALAIPASLYVYNNNYYRWSKYAYEAVYATTVLQDKDSTQLLSKINSKVLSKRTGKPLGLADYQEYRNEFKRNKDYSLLYFLAIWGVQVADATVFGHLKDFDVSDDLSMKVQPVYTPATKSAGVSLVFNFKTPARKSPPAY